MITILPNKVRKACKASQRKLRYSARIHPETKAARTLILVPTALLLAQQRSGGVLMQRPLHLFSGGRTPKKHVLLRKEAAWGADEQLVLSPRGPAVV
jgi:hypothetical protein